MRHKWNLPKTGAGNDTGANNVTLTEGAIAYWKRKQAIWGDLMKKADIVFRNCNPAYESPL
jgi:hypothetical protein